MHILGISEAEMRPRTKEEFAGQFSDPEFQQRCVDHFDNLTQQMISSIVAKRNELINKTGKKKTKQSGTENSNVRSSMEKETSSMIEMERRQMEKIKKRQQQEIEQMMEHEMKMQVIPQLLLYNLIIHITSKF